MNDARFTRRDVYEIVTSRILAALEKGTVPWHQPWTSQPPANLVSRKAYRGVNVFVLRCSPHSSPWWATYRQIQELGGHVRRGEHGTPVCFWKWLDKEEGDEENVERFPLLRYYTVFNSEQCEGIDHLIPKGKSSPADIAAAEMILQGMPNPPRLQHHTLQAAYHPGLDLVTIPPISQFNQAEAYYSTLFHELGHSTGHPTRLNRPTLSIPQVRQVQRHADVQHGQGLSAANLPCPRH